MWGAFKKQAGRRNTIIMKLQLGDKIYFPSYPGDLPFTVTEILDRPTYQVVAKSAAGLVKHLSMDGSTFFGGALTGMSFTPFIIGEPFNPVTERPRKDWEPEPNTPVIRRHDGVVILFEDIGTDGPVNAPYWCSEKGWEGDYYRLQDIAPLDYAYDMLNLESPPKQVEPPSYNRDCGADACSGECGEYKSTLGSIINYIENEAEIGIPIDFFFNEDGSNITKKKYGHILLKVLCEELREKFLTKQGKL